MNWITHRNVELKGIIGLLLLSCVLPFSALGQKAATKLESNADSAALSRSAAASRLPTKDDVNAAMTRSFGYDPAISWVIYEIRASPVPGVADVVISINKQAAQHIFMSEDTQNAIIGEMIPFGPNPFLQVRAKLAAADGPARGSQTPSILIVEFSDLECPHCKAAQPIIEKLGADFPRVRFVFQQFPLPASLHPWAMKAAEYSDCAEQLDPTSFWKFADEVFENQAAISLENVDTKLGEFATVAGLDAKKMAACAGLPATEARVKKSMDFGTSLDVHETPTVFINGRRVLSLASIPYDNLKKLVQFEIDHAGK